LTPVPADYETLKAFRDEASASLARDWLVRQDIDAAVVRFSRYRGMAGGGYFVKVAAADLPRAQALMDEVDRGIDLDEYVDPDDTSYRHCPHCGSANVSVAPLEGAAHLLAMATMGLYLLFARRDCRCAKCGAEWLD